MLRVLPCLRVMVLCVSSLLTISCGVSGQEAPLSTVSQVAGIPQKSEVREIPFSFVHSGPSIVGELEPQCRQAIRYMFLILAEMDDAVKSYCNRVGDACLKSTVSTQDPIRVSLSLGTSSSNTSSEALGKVSTTTSGKIDITVGVQIPLGATVVTTSVSASETAEGLAFIGAFFRNPGVLDGVFSKCPGLSGPADSPAK